MKFTKLIKFTTLLLLAGSIILPSFFWFTQQAKATTGINQQINFQGRLTDNNGLNVPDGSSYELDFALYNLSSGGGSIWTQNITGVTVSGGVFKVTLSVANTVDFNNNAIYLGMTVAKNGSGSLTGESEMTPRIQFTAAPYAYNADRVDGITFSGTSGNTYTLPSTNSGTILTTNQSSQTINTGQTSGTILSVAAGAPSLSGTLTGQSITLNGTGAQAETGLSFAVTGASGTKTDILGTSSNWQVLSNGVGTFATGTALGTQTFTSNNIADSGALTIKSGGANALTLDTGSGALLNIGNSTATTVNIGRSGQVVNFPGSIQIAGGTSRDIFTANASSANTIIIKPGLSSGGAGSNISVVGGDTSFNAVGAGSVNITGGYNSAASGPGGSNYFAGGGSANGGGGSIYFDPGVGSNGNGYLEFGQYFDPAHIRIGTATSGYVQIKSGSASSFAVTGNTLALSGSNFNISTTGVLTVAGGQTNDILSNGATSLKLDTGGAAGLSLGLSNATSLTFGNGTSNPTFAFNGSGTFGTSTGANSLNGDTTIAANKQLTFASGTGSINITGNAAVGGTTAGLIVKVDSSGNVATTGTSDLNLAVGVAIDTKTSGQAVRVATMGVATAIADSTITAGDFIGVGTVTAGRAKDLGATYPSTSGIQVLGRALTGASTGSTFSLILNGLDNSVASGGSPAFSAITAGTNTSQALLVGNSSTLGPTGTGTITANALSAGTYGNALTLSGATNSITAGTLTATGGTINNVVIGGSTAVAGTFIGGAHTALTGLGLRSTGAAFDLTLASSEVLTAGRTLSFVLGDAARTLDLTGGNLTISNAAKTISGAGTAIALGANFTVSGTNALTLTANSTGNTYTLPSPNTGSASTLITSNATTQTIGTGTSQTTGTILGISSGTPVLSGALNGQSITLNGTGSFAVNGLTFNVQGGNSQKDIVGTAGWSVTSAGVGTFITGSVIGSQTFTTNNIADSGALTLSSGGAGNLALNTAGGTVTSNATTLTANSATTLNATSLTTINSGSTLSVSGNLKVTGNNIQDSGGAAAITFDGSQNATYNGNINLAANKGLTYGVGTGTSNLTIKAGAGGTTTGLIVKVDSTASQVVTATTTDLNAAVGIATSTTSSGSNATVAIQGIVSTVADNTITVGDFIGVGTVTGGRAKSLGSIFPATSGLQVLGRALTAAVAGGNFNLLLTGMENNVSGTSGPFTSSGGLDFQNTTTDDVLFGGTTTSTSSFWFRETDGGSPAKAVLTIGKNGTLNGGLQFYCSTTCSSPPTIASDASGNLTISAPATNASVKIGSGTGNIGLTLSNLNDVFTGTKTVSLGAVAYTGINDYTFTRNITNTGANNQTGAVLKIVDTSSTAGTDTPDLLLINSQLASGTFTGNLINAQVGGTSRFTISSTGVITSVPTVATGTIFSITNSTAETAALVGQSITLSGTGAFDQTGLQFNLSNASGTNLNDIVGTSSTWKVSRAGLGTFVSGTVLGSQTFTTNNIADSGALTIKSGGTNALTLDSTTGGGTLNLGNTNASTIQVGNTVNNTAITYTSGNSAQTFNSTAATSNAFVFNANSATTGNALTISATSLSSGYGLSIAGPSSPNFNALNAAGNIRIDSQPNTANSAIQTFTKLSAATAGTIATGGTASIASVSATAVYNGSLYIGTSKTASAEVYRYDGATLGTFTKISVGTGQIMTAGQTSIDSVTDIVVFNGYLYVGVQKNSATAGNGAEVYRYNGGTGGSASWTQITGTAGTIGGGVTTAIWGVSSMAVYQGKLYVGTIKTAGAEVYRFDGGTTWTKVSGIAGTIGTPASQDSITSMVVYGQSLWVASNRGGTNATATATLYRYYGSANSTTGWVTENTTPGSFTINGGVVTGFTNINDMGNDDGSLVLGLQKAGAGEIVRYEDNGSSYGTTANNAFTRLGNSAGVLVSGGTTIDAVSEILMYNGKLYVSTTKSGAAEIYRYEGTPGQWTKISQATAGTVAAAGTAAIDNVSELIQYNADLLIGTQKNSGGAEVYKYTFISDQSYALKFHASLPEAGGEQNSLANEASMYFVASTSASLSMNKTLTGTFVFSHGIKTAYGAYDVAEDYPTRDESITAGDVVAIDPNESGMVVKSVGGYNPSAIGVYSENPGFLLSQQGDIIDGTSTVPVALAGRVPIKVSIENGPIHSGDLLTTSSQAGVAMHATKAGAVIGKAMADYSDNGVGKVLAYVYSGVSNGEQVASLLPSIGTTQDDHTAEYAQTILAAVDSQNAAIASQSSVSEITTDRLVAGLEVITPRLVVDEIIAKHIKAGSIDGLDGLSGQIASLQAHIATLEASINSGTTSSLSAQFNVLNSQITESIGTNGLSTSSGDLRVKGNGLIEGVLSVLDTLTAHNIMVTGMADFAQNVLFRSDVTFLGHTTFNSDTAGFVTVKKGDKSVSITFSKEYDKKPVISASVSVAKLTDTDFEQFVSQGTCQQDEGIDTCQQKLEAQFFATNPRYVISRQTTKGFTIVIDKPQDEDLTFSWTAFATLDENKQTASTTVSEQAKIDSILSKLEGGGSR